MAYVKGSFTEETMLVPDEDMDTDEFNEDGDDVWELPAMPRRQKSDSFATSTRHLLNDTPAFVIPKRQQSAPSSVLAAYVKRGFAEESVLASNEGLDDDLGQHDDDIWKVAAMPKKQISDSFVAPTHRLLDDAIPAFLFPKRQLSAPPGLENICSQIPWQHEPPIPTLSQTSTIEGDGADDADDASWNLSPLDHQVTEQRWPVWIPPVNTNQGSDDAKSVSTTASSAGDMSQSQSGEMGEKIGETAVADSTFVQAMMMKCAASALPYMYVESKTSAGTGVGRTSPTQEVVSAHRRRSPSLIDLAAQKQKGQQQKSERKQQRKNNTNNAKTKAAAPIGAQDFAPQPGLGRGDASIMSIPKFCTFCGAKTKPQFKFCAVCGVNLAQQVASFNASKLASM